MFFTFFTFVTAHMFGDYVFQNDFQANFKGKLNFILFVHSWIWSSCVGLALVINGYNFNVFDCLYLVIGHYFIDKYKCNKKDKTNALTKDLWIDQFLHFLQILALVLLKNY
ncbi:MAG: DUF3307 domain-containing protein [Aeromonas sp.]